MTDGPTRVLDLPEVLAGAECPTRSVPIRPRGPERAAPFTMTLSSRLGGDPVVPGYRILGRLGRGGMGVVYKAIHLALNRPVALKMLGGNAYELEPETRARFRKEAEALASLRHPNIVPVYEVGEADGLPFFTMELVDGGDLATRIRNQPPTPQEAARLTAQLAHGVQAAHDAGILHRDLKPSNVLLTGMPTPLPAASQASTLIPIVGQYTPMIADFGLAKRFGEARGTDRTMTQAGDILGTPSYMAPEQAEGHGGGTIGPGADIYALGAILYEMLVGRPPFDAEDAVRTVIQVLNDDPTPPARLAPHVPRDLETICLKCLQKDPRKRYATAALMADDLERFQAGRPIVARPVSTPERLWKWARRHPSIAGLLTAIVLLGVVALVGTTTLWMRANERADREKEARGLAEDRRKEIIKQSHETDYRLARGYMERGLAACQSRDVARGLIMMAKALEMTEMLRPLVEEGPRRERVEQLEWVVRTNLTAWQSRMQIRPRATFGPHHGGECRWVLDVDLSADGKRAILGTKDGDLRLFDAETNKEIGAPLQFDGQVFCTTFSPDSKRFAVARRDAKSNQDSVQVWDANTREPIGSEIPLGNFVLDPEYFVFANCGFVSDELLMVQTDEKTLRMYTPGTDVEVMPAIMSDVPITVCVPLPGQDVVITGHPDGSLRRWDVRTGMQTAGTRPTRDFIWTMACTPDGKRLVAGHWRGMARAWESDSLLAVGPPIRTKAVTEAGGDHKWRGFLRAVEISTDGKTVFTGGGLINSDKNLRGYMQSWDPVTAEQRYSFDQPIPAWGLAVTGDGSRVVSVAEDCTIRVFNAFDGAALETYTQRGNPGKVVIGRDGTSLMAGDLGSEPAPLLADLGPSPQAQPALHLLDGVHRLQYSPDGTRLLAIAGDQILRTLDPKTGKELAPPFPLTADRPSILLGPDAQSVALWTENSNVEGVLEVWDLATRQRRFTGAFPRLFGLAFVPDGGLIMSPCSLPTVIGLAPDGQTRWTYRVPGRADSADQAVAMEVSADGRRAVVGEYHSKVMYVIDATTGVQIGERWELPAHLAAAAVDPTGKLVVFGFREGFVQAYDLATRTRCGLAIPWRGKILGLKFNVDGKTLFVRTDDDLDQETARFDPLSGLQLGPTMINRSKNRINPLAFSPDGKIMATGDGHGYVRFWNLPAPMTGKAAEVRRELEMSSRTELLAEPAEIMRFLDDEAIGARRLQSRRDREKAAARELGQE